jgi:hypothetical protein
MAEETYSPCGDQEEKKRDWKEFRVPITPSKTCPQ